MTQSASLLPSSLSAAPRRRPFWRRLWRDISWVLMISGVLLLIDAGVTLIWQEPLTYVIALIKRGEINQRYLNYHSAPLSALDQRALAALHSLPRRIAYLARLEERQVPTG